MEVDAREYETYLESKVVVLLKGNRFLYGTMKSYDQYNSITLNFVTERIFHANFYAEKKHGLIVLRGENILFIAKCSAPLLDKLEKIEYEALKDKIEKDLSEIESLSIS